MKTGTRTTNGRGRLYDSIVDTVGRHALDPAQHTSRPPMCASTSRPSSSIPAASVKDRLAVSIIEAAERDGRLKPGQTVVEATSGNTGIGLAMVCAQKGYPLVVTMADSFSIERRKLMRMYGAKVVLTPRAQKGFGMYRKAVELAEANGWFLAHQFETEANCRHSRGHDRARNHQRFQGRAPRLLRHRLRHRRHGDRASGACCARSGRRRRSSCPSPPTRN